MEGIERSDVKKVRDVRKTSGYFIWVSRGTHSLFERQPSSPTIYVSYVLVAAYGFSELFPIVL
jgi:hypothetical protein